MHVNQFVAAVCISCMRECLCFHGLDYICISCCHYLDYVCGLICCRGYNCLYTRLSFLPLWLNIGLLPWLWSYTYIFESVCCRGLEPCKHTYMLMFATIVVHCHVYVYVFSVTVLVVNTCIYAHPWANQWTVIVNIYVYQNASALLQLFSVRLSVAYLLIVMLAIWILYTFTKLIWFAFDGKDLKAEIVVFVRGFPFCVKRKKKVDFTFCLYLPGFNLKRLK